MGGQHLNIVWGMTIREERGILSSRLKCEIARTPLEFMPFRPSSHILNRILAALNLVKTICFEFFLFKNRNISRSKNCRYVEQVKHAKFFGTQGKYGTLCSPKFWACIARRARRTRRNFWKVGQVSTFSTSFGRIQRRCSLQILEALGDCYLM